MRAVNVLATLVAAAFTAGTWLAVVPVLSTADPRNLRALIVWLSYVTIAGWVFFAALIFVYHRLFVLLTQRRH
jgi:hypothetical protein